MNYSVYILFSPKHERYYIGISQYIVKRLAEHNRGKVKSTKAFVPWLLVYVENLPTRQQARLREKYFKSSAGRRWRKRNVLIDKGD